MWTSNDLLPSCLVGNQHLAHGHFSRGLFVDPRGECVNRGCSALDHAVVSTCQKAQLLWQILSRLFVQNPGRPCKYATVERPSQKKTRRLHSPSRLHFTADLRRRSNKTTANWHAGRWPRKALWPMTRVDRSNAANNNAVPKDLPSVYMLHAAVSLSPFVSIIMVILQHHSSAVQRSFSFNAKKRNKTTDNMHGYNICESCKIANKLHRVYPLKEPGLNSDTNCNWSGTNGNTQDFSKAGIWIKYPKASKKQQKQLQQET